MKQLMLLFALLFSATVWSATPICKGTVSCQDSGVAGVVVTDGLHITTTDSKGRFALACSEGANYVYISTPAGYSSHVEDNVIKFYLSIDPLRKSYDFELTRETEDKTRHGFIVTADPQIYDRKEFKLLELAVDDIRATVEASDRPFHGICVGDIVSADHSFYPQYNGVMAASGLTWRNAMGNHDMRLWGRSHETSVSAFEKMYGPSHYSYNVGKIHYIILNDNFYIGRDWFYIGYLDERQFAWLERDLSHVPAGSTIVVGLHIPTMFKGKDTAAFSYGKSESTLCNYKVLHAMLEPYNAHIVSGHMHTTTNSDIRKNLYEHNIAAVSGAWWQGALCTDGTPAGYGVFEVDGADIKWYYKSTGHPREHQLNIYDKNDDPAFSGHVVANVWNCDPSWRVEMSVDGGQPIAMKPFYATDPQSRALYEDTSKLVHKWITITSTEHYYIAPISDDAKSVEVVAIDRFGDIYRSKKQLKN